MQQGIKKPQHVLVCSFMVQKGLLNDHLAHLPTAKDSPMAGEDTNKGNVTFNEANLAGIMLGCSSFMGESVQSDPHDAP
jgi:hypothetical protein